MSIKYMVDAWNMPLNSAEKILLLALADCANDDGFAYPGYALLTQKTGMAKATLSKCLKILKGAGIIKVGSHATFGQGKTVNTYVISLRVELPISSDLELIEKIKELRINASRPISSTLSPAKVQPSNCISSRVEHEPSSKPSLKQPSVLDISKKLSPDLLLLSEYGINGDLASDFIKLRKAKKAEITKTAMNGFKREADRAGISIAESVSIAIERNWVGFNAGWDWQPKQKSPNSATNRNSGFSKQLQQRPDYSSLWESDGAIDSTSTVINNEPARL